MAYRPGTTYTIVNGPSRFDLMLAVFDNKGVDRELVFVTQEQSGARHTHFVTIQEVAKLSSPDEWKLLGTISWLSEKVPRVTIRYNTQTRQGLLTFLGTDAQKEKPSFSGDNRRERVLMILIQRIIALYQNRHAGNLDEDIFRQFEYAKRVVHSESEKDFLRVLEELSINLQ